jgi:hypothetical protein
MKNILSKITPLRFAAFYVLIATIWLIVANLDDPSTIGWAFAFAIGTILFATVIFFVDYYLLNFIKNKTTFWIVQLLGFFACVWLFIKMGLPGHL